MNTDRELFLSIGMPDSVSRKKEIFRPSSVGVLVHTGDFECGNLSQEPEILLVRQADKNVNGFHPWGIPAGKAEGEEGIIQVAEREVGEETGIILVQSRLKWFCPAGDRKAILSYRVETMEIPHWQQIEEHQLGIKTLTIGTNVDPREIDRLALVPVGVFFDHRLVGSQHVYRKKSLLQEYLYYPKSTEVNENIDFVPVVYRPDIWQAIRHQMFVRKILPSCLG